MLISELKNGIVRGQLNNFYIFTGQEEGIMSVYIKQIAKKLNLAMKWVDSVEEILSRVNLKSITKVRYLYLVRVDNSFKSQEKLWQKVLNINGNYAILIQPEIDKRSTKFIKFFENNIIDFEKLSPSLLEGYAKRLCSGLSTKNIQDLISWCDNSYSRLINELDKVNTLSKAENISQDGAFRQLVEENGIFRENEIDVFKYVNYMLSRNLYECLKFNSYIENTQQEILVISLLFDAFKNFYLLKQDGGGKGVCDRTGMTSWQVKTAIDFHKNYELSECEENMLFLQDLEVKIKTGAVTPGQLNMYIISEVVCQH